MTEISEKLAGWIGGFWIWRLDAQRRNTRVCPYAHTRNTTRHSSSTCAFLAPRLWRTKLNPPEIGAPPPPPPAFPRAPFRRYFFATHFLLYYEHNSTHVYATMREKDTLLVGLLTVCAVSTAALVRLIAVCRIFRQQRRRSFTNGSLLDHQHQTTTDDRVASSRILVPSLLFHVMVFLCLVVEVPVYAWRWLSASGIASFVEEGRQLYALHMVSFLLLYMAFSVVITLWSDVAVFEPNEWTALMNRWGRWAGREVHISWLCAHHTRTPPFMLFLRI